MRISIGIALVVASGVLGFAQSLPAPPGLGSPAFEVASVKRNLTDDKGPRRAEPDRFVSIGWPLRYVIATAYRARGLQVVGGPAWIDTDFFDINAKAPEKTPAADILPMVRGLLAQRFKLRAHVEQREMPVYVLVLARADGRLGPGMRRTTQNCAQLRAASKTTPGQPGEFPVCASRLRAMAPKGTLTLEMAEGGISISAFIPNMSSYLPDRLVIDRTGLKGDFDIQLQFELPGAGPAPVTPDAATPADDAPTLFNAVQQQLGLKLRPERAPVDVLVIDSVEPPTPD